MEWVSTNTGKVVSSEPRPTPKKKIVAKKLVVRKSVKQTAEQVREEIFRNPRYRFAVEIAETLIDLFDLHTKFKPPVFRNNQRCMYYPEKRRVVYSYSSLNETFEKGFVEYITVAKIWNDPYTIERDYNSRMARFEGGYKGLWRLAVHEFAHQLHWYRIEFENLPKGKAHGPMYKRILQEVAEICPFNDSLVQDLISS
jgi:hypothetical protein